MILTITPNPSIDLLFDADQLLWEDANRVEMPRRRAGGQGINLTRAARALGGDSAAMALLGGYVGAELSALLAAEGTQLLAVPIAGETRVFVAVREHSSGRSLLINPRGPVLSDADRARLLARIETACRELGPTWLVCSGSVPRGVGTDVYAAVSRLARANGARFVADCDGEALEKAVAAGCDLLAPNQHEAGRLLGRSIESVAGAAAAARALRKAAPRVLIKLGDQGAVLGDEQGCWHAQGQPIARGSAVGAGDAFLAAFMVSVETGTPPHEALRRAVAAGSAVLLSTGADLLRREDYEAQLANVAVSAM